MTLTCRRYLSLYVGRPLCASGPRGRFRSPAIRYLYLPLYYMGTTIGHVKGVEGRLTEVSQSSGLRASEFARSLLMCGNWEAVVR